MSPRHPSQPKYEKRHRERCGWRGTCEDCGLPRGKGRENRTRCEICQRKQTEANREFRQRRACLYLVVTQTAKGSGFPGSVARAFMAEVERRLTTRRIRAAEIKGATT